MADLLGCAILGTGTALEGAPRSTRALAEVAFPGRAPAELERRTGILERRWVGAEVTVAGLAAAALGRALADADLPAHRLRRIVLVTSTGGDQRVPATANDVAGALGLDGSCDAFDVNNSCVGFLSGLDLAARSVATGLQPVGLVAVEIFSRLLAPAGPRAYVTLGDGAAALVLGPAAGGGVVGSSLRNLAPLRGRLGLAHPGTPGARPHHEFTVRAGEIQAVALPALEARITEALAEAGLGAEDVRWWIPHQPSGAVGEELSRRLGLAPDRIVSALAWAGNVGAASIPLALDGLRRAHPLAPGEHVMMAAFGAGSASGAMLFKA